MNPKKTKLIVTAFATALMSTLAHAQSVVSDQSLGETYEASSRGSVGLKIGGTFEADGRCDKTVVNKIDYREEFSLVTFYNLEKDFPYSEDYVHEEKVSGNRYCEWNASTILNDIVKAGTPWTGSKREIVLDRMTDDGTALEGRYVIQNPSLTKRLASGSDTFDGFITLKLQSCLTDRGDNVTSFVDQDANTDDIASLIADLRKRGYRNFIKCVLPVDIKNFNTDTFTDGETYSTVDNGTFLINLESANPDHLYMTHGAQAIEDQFARSGSKRDADKEKIALKASEDFISFIENDYADLLYSLNNASISEVERNQAIRGFFNNNSAKIKDLLGKIDSNYADVSLMNKVSLMISIQDAYKTIAKVEKSISSSSPISLDRVVHQN